MTPCRIQFRRGERIVAEFIGQRTDSALERMRGLLFSAPLQAEQALMITPCNSVHSFLMQYAIDVAYINRENEVCHTVSTLKPWRASAHLRAAYVVEMAAGRIAQTGIQPGDRCQCVDL